MLDFNACLDLATKIHGNSCARLVVGTRMAVAGLRAVHIKDPKEKDRSKIMVFVEIDRCVSDAIIAVTGCSPGKRTMRIIDYGKVAATFLNLETGRAVRLSINGRSSRSRGDANARICPADSRVKPFMGLSDCELFRIEEVAVILRPEDMPGDLLWTAVCDRCGEMVLDLRNVHVGGSTLCSPCAKGVSYYTGRCAHERPVTSAAHRMMPSAEPIPGRSVHDT